MSRASASDAIVVTGLGSVLSAGAGRQALSEALQRGEPTVQPIEPVTGFHLPGASRLAALANHVDLTPWLSRRAARRMSQPSRYAVAAGRMAIEAATLTPEEIAQGDTAVVLGTAFGTARFAEALIDDILRRGPESASPFHFSESVANAPSAQVAIALGARGANVAVTQREASALLAVAAGAREVRLGRSRWALAGATDEINPLVHAVLGRFGALADPAPNGRETARPFAPDRSGFLAAEGSAILVLETENSALERGAEKLVRLRCAVRAFDPTAPPHDWGFGHAELVGRLRRGLERANLQPFDIDHVVSGASGARRGDQLEREILDALFAPRQVPDISTPKSIVGEFGGGALAAAVETVAATGGPRRALVSALAAGGAAAWLVLERP